MADDITPHGDTPDPVAPEPVEPKETDWKAEARKWESRAKENLAHARANEDAAKRLAEYEEAQKTEEQKRAEELDALRAEVNGYKTQHQIAEWKAQVAEATGVPAEILAGSTLEEIEAHAAKIAPRLASAPAAPAGPVVPTEGVTRGSGASQLTQSDLATMTPAQINQARREGRLNRVLGIA